jgi:GT2 family glycosyltransferase
MRTAVITTVHGRPRHLHRQLVGIAGSAKSPDTHVVVAVDDPAAADVVANSESTAHVVQCRNGPGPLRIASARNIGALAALERGAEILVFLDVDCIPGRAMLGRYYDAVRNPTHQDALLCGPVTYLPPPEDPEIGYPLTLDSLTNPHPARPAPPDREVVASSDYELFWSLSFALTSSTWRTVGGFCEHYRGYGAEDTDFAQMARSAGVPLRWVGGAHAYHQFHPVSDPPVEHVHDIVRNATTFHRRWGWWPMIGWLNAFEQRGLIVRDKDCRPRVLQAASADSQSVN